MRFLLRPLMAALVLTFAGQAYAQKSFNRDDLASESIRLEEKLKAESAGVSARTPKADAEAALRKGDVRKALSLFSLAVTTEPKNAASWLAFAKSAKALEAKDFSERYRLQERAAVAAYTAYQKAASRDAEAEALAVLGDVYAWRQMWRPGLDAYKVSLQLKDDGSIRRLYEDIREKYGFRLLDYNVDSDSAAPRVCFQFSESLKGKIDFTPFVAVSGAANAAVTAEDAQLCVDGLKHGQRYAMVLRQGLPAAVDETLLKSADYEIYVKDRAPQVRFTGRNYVLPKIGQEGIPVVSVNTEKADVELYRIGDRNLLPTVRSEDFLAQMNGSSVQNLANEKGVKIWSGTLDVKSELNKDVVTAFPVLDAVGKLEPGVYVMLAAPAGGVTFEEDEHAKATQWFVVSDLGLTAFSAQDGIHVMVRSLAQAEPIANVEIRLIARNNDILAVKTTDGAGYAKFDANLSKGTGGLSAGLVVAATPQGDYGFLDLGQAAFDLTDRGVKGRIASGPIEAFLFTERGVYRSGEMVFLTSLLRDAKGSAQFGLPLTLVVRRPDGVENRRVLVEDQGLGGRSFALPLLQGSMHGTWRIQAYADPKGEAIGEVSFLVEDYVPERLELTLNPKTPTLLAGQPAEIEANVRYLYGAPGAGLEISGEVAAQPAAETGIPGLKGFAVGLSDEPIEASSAEIEDKAVTDSQGRARVIAPVPDVSAPRPMEAKITLRAGEAGGRNVERIVVLPILPSTPVLAVKKNFSDEGLSDGATATFDVVAAAPDGRKLAAKGVSWSLYRVERRYQWYNNDGRWGYEPVKSTKRVVDGQLDLAADAPGRIAMPVSWGSYRLDLRKDGELASVSLSFNVGYSGETKADTPDLLEMSLDKPGYKPGETMSVKLNPRFKGKATIAVVSDKVQDMRVVEVPAEGAAIELSVKAEWGAGAYLVAMVHRPLDTAMQRMPGRALGLAWFEIDRAAHTLNVEIGAAGEIRPRGTLTVPLKVKGAAPGEEAWISVAAVDVGILNLTRYPTPDASEFFFGQKQLSAELRDLYGYLIDGMQGVRGAIRSGGDAAASLEGTAPAQEPVAHYSGLVKVGPDGQAQAAFEIPAFNGTLRLTAVAWSKDRVGQAVKDVIVRDPVVLTASLPRFLSVNDASRLLVQIDNVEGAAGEYAVEIASTGPVGLDTKRKTIKLEKKGQGSLSFPIKASGIGDASFELTLSGAGLKVSQTLSLHVQPGTAPLVRRIVRPLAPGSVLGVSNDLLSDILPGTGAVSVAVSPLGLDVPSLLQSLDRYPYGCSEQIVSRAMPLLYVNKLATSEALALDPDLDGRINEAIQRVMARQSSNGSFGLWSVGGEDLWLDAFVTDFLTRARERGFAVPPKAFASALDRLRNFIANTTEFEAGKGGDLAYAAYVLARNGRPVMGDLRYLSDTKLAAFGTPLAKAQIGAALALLGDRGRAQTAFAGALESLRGSKRDLFSRPDYGSRLRDGAGLLALAAETGFAKEATAPVTRILDEERSPYTSTQEKTWMVLAAQAVGQGDSIALDIAGQPHKGAFYRVFRETSLASPVGLTNAGSAAVQASLSVTGHPVAPEPAASQGYAIERGYYKLDGTRIEPSRVKQNDRLVVVLKVTETEARYARLLLVDRLPAGFEIDNPKLVDSGSVEALNWLKTDVQPSNLEYRDDRFVAAFDRDTGQPAMFTVAYIVRAVSPGQYMHPPAQIEDMYRPDRFGRTAFGKVEVTGK